MQCASSTTSSPTVLTRSESTSRRNRSLFSRSGEISRRSTSPSRTWCSISSHSSRFPLLIVAARTPARSAIWIWLRMSASSGETSSVGPAPRSRSRRVATKYTALLPHPVRCTTRTRRRRSTSSSIASHCPGRNPAATPAVSRRSSSPAAAREVLRSPRSLRSMNGGFQSRALARQGREDFYHTPATAPRRAGTVALTGLRRSRCAAGMSEPAPTLHLTAVIAREGDWYVARCLEVEAVSQGDTVEQALANLRDVVEVYLEEEGVPPTAAPAPPLVTSTDVPIPA